LDQPIAHLEVIPNKAGTRCISSYSLSDDADPIPAGGTNSYIVTLGPVEEEQISDLILDVRMFRGLEDGWVDGQFTLELGSGEILMDS